MSSTPVSQFPLPPPFYAQQTPPPQLPEQGADVRIFGGTVPRTPLAPEGSDSNYGEELKGWVDAFHPPIFKSSDHLSCYA